LIHSDSLLSFIYFISVYFSPLPFFISPLPIPLN
jgi:hypothetical protein